MSIVIALLLCAVGCFGAAGLLIVLHRRRQRWLDGRLFLDYLVTVYGTTLPELHLWMLA